MKRKNNVIVVLSIVLMLSFLAGILSVLTAGFENWDYSSWLDRFNPEEVTIIEAEVPSAMSFEVVSIPNMDLKLGVAGVNVGGYSTHTINATILPTTAIDKYVIWGVEWATPESTFATGKNVTDYITVVPTTEGSTSALITCLLSFRGEQIKVSATSRSGGFTSYCVVNFVGIPTSYNITPVGTIDSVEGMYVFIPGNTYNFNITFNNIYNDTVAPTSYNSFPNGCNFSYRYGIDRDAFRVIKKINGNDMFSTDVEGLFPDFYDFLKNQITYSHDYVNQTFSFTIPSDLFAREYSDPIGGGLYYKYTLDPSTGWKYTNYLIVDPAHVQSDPIDNDNYSTHYGFQYGSKSFHLTGNTIKFFFATDTTGLTLDESEIDIL